ncbi:hypothetical protein N7523_004796 [Penicillium sp. IBT 18751x]|nr:hypothetical protein N7523_004796 [Penicillium sp. IBT 18751x]
MKTAAILCLAAGALAAPTRTIESRQFGSSGSGLAGLGSAFGGSSGTSSGLSSLESAFSSLGSGSSTSGGLGALSSLIPSFGSGSTGSTTSGGLDALESAFSGSSGLGSFLKSRAYTSSITANGITDGDACQELTFIFARGSDELGNMGSVVGPEVASQLNTLLNGKVVVQGVTYDATAESNVELGANGGPVMAKLVTDVLAKCPNTKVVLGGYSQGSMVLHNAMSKLSSGNVAGAVLFGDPFKAQAVSNIDASKVKEFCAVGDPVCENGFNVMAHLSYGSDASTAASFLVKAAGLS